MNLVPTVLQDSILRKVAVEFNTPGCRLNLEGKRPNLNPVGADPVLEDGRLLDDLTTFAAHGLFSPRVGHTFDRVKEGPRYPDSMVEEIAVIRDFDVIVILAQTKR